MRAPAAGRNWEGYVRICQVAYGTIAERICGTQRRRRPVPHWGGCLRDDSGHSITGSSGMRQAFYQQVRLLSALLWELIP